MNVTRPSTRWVTATAVAAAVLFASTAAFAQSARMGATFAPAPFDGRVHRFPSIAHDAVNDAYLVVWTHIGAIGARFVSAEGHLLGDKTQINTSAFARQAGAVRATCAAAVNACLIAWVEEKPFQIVGRLVRFSGGAVAPLSPAFVVADSLTLTSSTPSVAYSPASNEFLVAWTSFGAGLDVTAQRVSPGGFPIGGQIPIASTGIAEFFPTVAYNSAQNEFLVAYNFEEGPGSYVGAQRVQPGTGALIGLRSTLYGSAFEQYPEIAYDPLHNQYLAITWNIGGGWMLHGALADGSANPVTGILPLALSGGGDGIGIAFNPATNTYFSVFQSTRNDEMFGAEIVGGTGAPFTQFQVTVSGTRLTVQPRAAADPLGRTRFLTIAADNNSRIIGQFVGSGPMPAAVGSSGGGGTQPPPPPPPPTGCPSVQPAPNWTCVNGNWLPPTSTGGGGGNPSCPSVQPAPNWTCVNGNWMPPTTSGGGGTSACPSVQPAPNWTCVSGNWMPPTTSGSGNASCPSVQPGPDWVCVNGNWLPGAGGGGSTSSCTTIQPAPNWVCVNGNWLPGSGGGSSTASCTTIQPAPNWVCVNGNWLPGSGGGSSTASCTTIQPAPDWVCVNGNWLPGGGGGGGGVSCVTPQPGPGWVCSNGNWLPGGGSITSTNSCSTVQPAPDWLCSNGNWLPPAMVCPSVKPGPDWVCSNGNWLPPGFGGDD